MTESYNSCFSQSNKSCFAVAAMLARLRGMNLGARVQSERLARGWSQAKLAQLVTLALGAGADAALSQQALDRLEKRDSKTSEHAVQLADALGVSLRWLLCGVGRKSDSEWPFDRVDRRRWDAASDVDRGYVQAAMNRALDECEAGAPSVAPANPTLPADFVALWQALGARERQTLTREARALLPLDAPVKL